MHNITNLSTVNTAECTCKYQYRLTIMAKPYAEVEASATSITTCKWVSPQQKRAHSQLCNTTTHVPQSPNEHDSFPPCSMRTQVSEDQQARQIECLLRTPNHFLAYPSPQPGPPAHWPHCPNQSHSQTAGFPAGQDSGISFTHAIYSWGFCVEKPCLVSLSVTTGCMQMCKDHVGISNSGFAIQMLL